MNRIAALIKQHLPSIMIFVLGALCAKSIDYFVPSLFRSLETPIVSLCQMGKYAVYNDNIDVFTTSYGNKLYWVGYMEGYILELKNGSDLPIIANQLLFSKKVQDSKMVDKRPYWFNENLDDNLIQPGQQKFIKFLDPRLIYFNLPLEISKGTQDMGKSELKLNMTDVHGKRHEIVLLTGQEDIHVLIRSVYFSNFKDMAGIQLIDHSDSIEDDHYQKQILMITPNEG